MKRVRSEEEEEQGAGSFFETHPVLAYALIPLSLVDRNSLSLTCSMLYHTFSRLDAPLRAMRQISLTHPIADVGWTPWMEAVCAAGHLECVQHFWYRDHFDYGALCNGMHYLECAPKSGHEHIMRFLTLKAAVTSDPRIFRETVRSLIRHGHGPLAIRVQENAQGDVWWNGLSSQARTDTMSYGDVIHYGIIVAIDKERPATFDYFWRRIPSKILQQEVGVLLENYVSATQKLVAHVTRRIAEAKNE